MEINKKELRKLSRKFRSLGSDVINADYREQIDLLKEFIDYVDKTSEKAKKEGLNPNICLKTLYNYIHGEIFIELTQKHLPYKKSYKKSYRKKMKKTIRKIGVRQIKRIQDWMNSMPRKMFNGKSADEIYTQMRLNSQNS